MILRFRQKVSTEYVDFYSAFMVADRVEVTARRAGAEEAWTWASEGHGEYTLAPASHEEAGTAA
jgi:molecular chaperone HtpG